MQINAFNRPDNLSLVNVTWIISRRLHRFCMYSSQTIRRLVTKYILSFKNQFKMFLFFLYSAHYSFFKIHYVGSYCIGRISTDHVCSSPTYIDSLVTNTNSCGHFLALSELSHKIYMRGRSLIGWRVGKSAQ
jgi:hypothetical protein